MSNHDCPLLAVVRSELQELTTRTLSLAAQCAFRRERDPIVGIATILAPTVLQSATARANDERLRQWSAIVSSVLRRGGVAAPDLQSLVHDLSTRVLLKRRDRATIRQSKWRSAFDNEVMTLRMGLDRLLSDSSLVFCAARESGPAVHVALDLLVQTWGVDQWRVDAVTDSERATEIVAAPLPAAIEDFLTMYCGPDQGRTANTVPRVMESLTALGGKLFLTVFQASVAALYRRIRERARCHSRGLRVQFAAHSLAEVPWELLHDGARFLCMQNDISVSRCVAGATKERQPESGAPLRILLTVSSPRGLPAIDCEAERRTVDEAVSSRRALGLLQLDIAPDGSLGTLRRLLRRAELEGRPYHAWHFAGHGQYDPDARRSVIAMTDDAKETHWVGGPELATIFAESTALRLIVLKSCEGAAGDLAGQWCSLVPALMASGGASAVVAMRFDLSYDASSLFDEEFYGAIADGATVDEAVAAARRAIVDRPNYTEWITPAVFRCGGEVAWFDSALP